jgi:hypothetical protein
MDAPRKNCIDTAQIDLNSTGALLISKTAVHAKPAIKQFAAWYKKRCKKFVKTKLNAINFLGAHGGA